MRSSQSVVLAVHPIYLDSSTRTGCIRSTEGRCQSRPGSNWPITTSLLLSPAAMVEHTASLVDDEVSEGEQEASGADAENGNDEGEDDGEQDAGSAEGRDRGSNDEADSTGQKRFAVGDKGYHKNEELAKLVKAGFEPLIAEPAGRQVPKRNKGQAEAFETNRDNRQSEQGRELLRKRGEKVERSFRHLLDHGGARRTTLSGHEKIAKRMLISALGFNLCLGRYLESRPHLSSPSRLLVLLSNNNDDKNYDPPLHSISVNLIVS